LLRGKRHTSTDCRSDPCQFVLRERHRGSHYQPADSDIDQYRLCYADYFKHRFNRGELSQKEAQLEIEHFWAGALRKAVIDGDVEGGSLMAGQSVGMVTREQSTAEILGELIDQALAVIAGRANRPDRPPQFSGSAEALDPGG